MGAPISTKKKMYYNACLVVNCTHGGRNVSRFSKLRGPPDHEVREYTNPDYTSKEHVHIAPSTTASTMLRYCMYAKEERSNDSILIGTFSSMGTNYTTELQTTALLYCMATENFYFI